MRKENGDVCILPNEAVEVWLNFFRKMEGGVRMDLHTQRELWISNLAALRQHDFDIAAEELPRLLDLEAALRRVNSTKATGPDQMHPGICCAAPQILARKLFGPLMKLVVHGQEALLHKGGLLHPVWKAKGRKDCCASYRSILISSHIGKSIHRSIRQHQNTLFTKFLQQEQLGGRPRVPVTLGVHIGRSFMRAKKRQGQNVAMLYLDLTEAFYRILRPLVVGGDIDDELILYVGSRLGLSADLLADLHRHLEEPAAISRAGLQWHQQNTLRALHQDTHFHVKGQVDRCHTSLGSRPGDCFADVIFSYLWSRILCGLQQQLHYLGLAEQIPHHAGLLLDEDQWPPLTQQGFLGPTWMDDTCVCAADACPFRLEAKITQAASILLSLCDGHGLSPNLQAGKTAVLLAFQGKHSKQMKIKYFGPTAEKCIVVVGEMDTKKIRVVSQYSHLGCIIQHRSDHRREARRRIGIAQQAFSQHRRYLLQNPHLSCHRRIEMFKTLVLSRFGYGTESWTLEDARTKEFVHNALLRLYRRLLRWGPDVHARDDDVLTAANMNSPTEVLRIARLRYLGTLYRCKELVPWGLLNSDAAWTSLIKDDLTWMWQELHGASSLQDPSQHFSAWEYIWLHHPSYRKRLIRRAGEHAIRQRARLHRVNHFHERFRAAFQQVQPHLFAPLTGAQRVISTEEIFACMACGSTFGSKGGLGAHLFKRHGVTAKVRLLFQSTACGSCLKEYHTLSKLQAHLQNTDNCRRRLWGRRRYLLPTSGCGSAVDQQLCQQHDGILPPLQGEGPQLPDGVLEDIPMHDLEVAEQIYLCLLDCHDGDLVEQTVRDVITASPISWHTCRATLDYMLAELSTEDIAVLDIGEIDIKQILQNLKEIEAWSFLRREADKHDSMDAQGRLAAYAEQCRVGGLATAERGRLWPVPRPMAKERYIIHAFSGRRRIGDFQYFVEQAQVRHPETLLHTISVDIVVDPLWGDVSRPEVREFWLRAVKERHVVGAMAGPPCETWSKARGRAPEQITDSVCKRGPRVIRDASDLWGKVSLALKELRQLDVGNLLLLFMLELLINLALEDGIGGMEHPAEPAEPELTSVWRLPVIEYLRTWPEFSFRAWGAPSRKPTGLLLLNMPNAFRQLREWQLVGDFPKTASIGKNSEGFWATSLLKEYPPAFCGGLAGGFISALQEHPVDANLVPSHDFCRQAWPMIVSEMQACAGPDFAGDR